MNDGYTITSYATGAVNGGDGNDYVGGLVGYNYGGGSAIACYATVAVDGGAGDGDLIESLVGEDAGPGNEASYGFGNTARGTVRTRRSNPPPAGVVSARDLTAANAGAGWNDAGKKTKDAWDFGTADQPPALRYADYDGDGADFSCDMSPACNSLLPGQR